jgi:hypothetical protein
MPHGKLKSCLSDQLIVFPPVSAVELGTYLLLVFSRYPAHNP